MQTKMRPPVLAKLFRLLDSCSYVLGFWSFFGSGFKAGVNMKAVFWLGIMVLTQISRSRFKQSKISLLIPHIYIFGDFWVYLGINSFSQRISKIYGNRKF